MYSYMSKTICELNVKSLIYIHIQHAHPNRICHELLIYVESEMCNLLFHCEHSNEQLCWNVLCCQGRHERGGKVPLLLLLEIRARAFSDFRRFTLHLAPRKSGLYSSPILQKSGLYVSPILEDLR